MGIKGIYKEIGAGTRIAFTRLAVDSLEKRNRPLRLAIDISIWQFQVQAARGGANPAIRTLFYRLVRLLGMPVHPVFVFDGLNKPQFKRNKRSGTGDGMATAMAKRLIKLFGFAVHDAPGEAEAECALLQQRGVVDAVLSEDVDTLMFGCTRTLRNWSGPQQTASKSAGGGGASKPTHVSMYESARLGQSESGLDREGMVLVALMSGGDYLPEGVPGCGVKLACEAAKAGFGRSLCRLKRSDAPALALWRTTLQQELRTNESRFFRTCHHKLAIPEGFPNLEILRYYTHPVVSPPEVVERVRDTLDSADGEDRVQRLARDKPIDVPGLRDFVAETFDWTNRAGAVKFIRVLAPSLLARILLLRWSGDYEATEEEEDSDVLSTLPALVQGITKQRTHLSTDETPEMRVSFIPVSVVGIDLDAEHDVPLAIYGRDGLALNSDDEFDEPAPSAMEDGATQQQVPSSGTVAAATRKSAPFDPTQPDVAWIARAIVQIGAPQALAAFEERQKRAKGGAAKTKAVGSSKASGAGGGVRGKSSKATANTGMKAGALDRYVKVSKSTASQQQQPEKEANRERRAQVGTAVEEEDHSWERLIRQLQEQPARPQTQKSTPRQKGAEPWTLSGAPSARITKAGSDQQRKTTKSAKAQSARPEVIDLLSSPSQPARPASTLPQTLPQPLPSTPTKATRPGRSSTMLSSPAKNSPTKKRTTGASGIGRSKSQAAALANVSMTTGSSPRQTSIRTFFTKPEVPAATATSNTVILLSSDDDDDASVFVRPRRQRAEEATEAGEDALTAFSSPFSSSPPVFSPAAKATPRRRPSFNSSVSKPPIKSPTKATRTKKTVYVPRTSAVGYFREEVVDAEEDNLLQQLAGSGGDETDGHPRRRGWRQSEIGIVDLTEMDKA